MFFFFNSNFEKGKIYEVISVHHPALADAIGRRFIVTTVNSDGRSAWAHDAKPVRYRENRNGVMVTEYDPRCCSSLYWIDHVREVNPAVAEELLAHMGRSWN